MVYIKSYTIFVLTKSKTMTTSTSNTAAKVANTLRYAGFKALCVKGAFITVKGLGEYERVQLEEMISKLYPNFKGLIFSI